MAPLDPLTLRRRRPSAPPDTSDAPTAPRCSTATIPPAVPSGNFRRTALLTRQGATDPPFAGPKRAGLPPAPAPDAAADTAAGAAAQPPPPPPELPVQTGYVPPQPGEGGLPAWRRGYERAVRERQQRRLDNAAGTLAAGGGGGMLLDGTPAAASGGGERRRRGPRADDGGVRAEEGVEGAAAETGEEESFYFGYPSSSTSAAERVSRGGRCRRGFVEREIFSDANEVTLQRREFAAELAVFEKMQTIEREERKRRERELEEQYANTGHWFFDGRRRHRALSEVSSASVRRSLRLDPEEIAQKKADRRRAEEYAGELDAQIRTREDDRRRRRSEPEDHADEYWRAKPPQQQHQQQQQAVKPRRAVVPVVDPKTLPPVNPISFQPIIYPHDAAAAAAATAGIRRGRGRGRARRRHDDDDDDHDDDDRRFIYPMSTLAPPRQQAAQATPVFHGRRTAHARALSSPRRRREAEALWREKESDLHRWQAQRAADRRLEREAGVRRISLAPRTQTRTKLPVPHNNNGLKFSNSYPWKWEEEGND
ncbi:hypothetical protein DFJ73DRAFT_958671 [Zopfochytrium polystomum]|nr:hypothetical protein DFJ73DRAFT_958671 [Zopfochytrium polystomum]